MVDDDREQLRERALARWADAKRLNAAAHDLVDVAEGLRHDARDVASRARGTRLVSVTARIDRFLAEARVETAAWTGTIGLVCASEPELILGLRRQTGTGCEQIIGAQDGAIAIALAIAAQPDVGVVRDDLPLVEPLDVLERLHAFAPRTALLMLTDRAGVERSARALGASTLPCQTSHQAIAQTMNELIA